MNIASVPKQWHDSMSQAIQLAAVAAKQGDVPVGALVIGPDGTVVGQGYNQRELNGDPLAHAEMVAIQQAGMLNNRRSSCAINASRPSQLCGEAAHESSSMPRWNLSDMTLVVTLEPCPMCAGAALAAHIGRIVFGAWDPKMGACGSVWDIPRDPHIGARPEVVGGVQEEACTAMLNNFFRKLR
jgi:tRNA(adenine34) deaminase